MHILIAHGSKYGGTEGLAKQIAATLRELGSHTVDVRPGRELDGLGGYDAVIVGGGLYAELWHRSARSFVVRHVDELRCMPVWMFSSGPLDHSASERVLPPTRWVARLIDLVGARGHATFGGRLTNDVRGFIAKALVQQGRGGDFRDMDAVAAWAREIDEQLTTLPVHATRPAKRSDGVVRRTLAGLGWFTGITAVWGGIGLIGSPQGSGMLPPIELLAGTPFDGFLVPGLLLAGIVGLSNLASAVLMHRRHRAAELIGFAAGVALTVWIVVQMAMLQAFHWLQALYLGVGLATAVLAVWLGARRWMALRERRSAAPGRVPERQVVDAGSITHNHGSTPRAA